MSQFSNKESPIPAAELAIGLAGFLVVFFSILFRNETFFLRDLLSFQRPLAMILVRLMGEGGSLLWNPWLADGQPFAANPNALVHHPISLVFRLMPFEWAFRTVVLAPVVVSGLAMVLLLRSLGRSWAAGVFGGTAWAISGGVLSSTNLVANLLALAPLPAVAGLARLEAQGKYRRAGGWLALVFGLELAAGEPALLLATIPVIAAALWAGAPARTVDADSRTERPAGRKALRLLLPLGLGVLLGAATLLPAAALAHRSVRGERGGLTAAEAQTWSFPPLRLAELLAPQVLGDAENDREEPGWYFGAALYPRKGAPYVVSIYGGVLAVLLAATAFRRRLREELPWLLLFAGAVLVAAGEHTPVFGLLRSIFTPLATLRYPERFVLVALLALVPPAARGLDLVIADEPSRRTWRRMLLACAACSLLAAVALRLAPYVAGTDCWARFGLVPARIADAVARQIPVDALRPGLLALGALAALRLCRGKRERRLPILLQLLIVIDLAILGRSLVVSRPVSEVVAPPAPLAPIAAAPPGGPLFHAAALDQRRGYAVRLAPPPEPALWKIATTLDPDFDRMQLKWTSGGNDRVRGAIRTDPALIAPLLARRGVAAVLTFQGEPGARGNPLRLELLRPVDRRPPVFIPDRVVSIDNDQEWLSAARGLGAEAGRSAIVEKAELSGLPSGYGTGKIESFTMTPGRIHASVSVDPGPWTLLAINQSWDEGWRASIDHGPEIAARRIDLSLIGVPLTPGRHDVSIEYRDPWDQRGRIASRIGLIGAVILLLLRPRRPA